MTDNITMPRSVAEKALEDLEMTINYVQSPTRREDMRDSIEALRAALEQPQVQSGGIPPNWKLVPVEPADSQIRAAQDTWWHACNCETYWDQIYAAMLAAAPQPPVVEQPQVEAATGKDYLQVPAGFVLLQTENGKPVYSACLDGGRFHGWLMWKHPDGQWVSKRKLEAWEIMQAEDQRDYGIVQGD